MVKPVKSGISHLEIYDAILRSRNGDSTALVRTLPEILDFGKKILSRFPYGNHCEPQELTTALYEKLENSSTASAIENAIRDGNEAYLSTSFSRIAQDVIMRNSPDGAEHKKLRDAVTVELRRLVEQGKARCLSGANGDYIITGGDNTRRATPEDFQRLRPSRSQSVAEATRSAARELNKIFRTNDLVDVLWEERRPMQAVYDEETCAVEVEFTAELASPKLKVECEDFLRRRLDDIQRKILAEGDKIPARELARKFSVSAATVSRQRKALHEKIRAFLGEQNSLTDEDGRQEIYKLMQAMAAEMEMYSQV